MVADGFVENFIVILECVVDEELAHCLVVHMCGKRGHGPHKTIRVREVFCKEIQNHVAAVGIVARIHGHLTEEITHVGIYYRQRAETVPEIVEGIQCLYAYACSLIFKSDK